MTQVESQALVNYLSIILRSFFSYLGNLLSEKWLQSHGPRTSFYADLFLLAWSQLLHIVLGLWSSTTLAMGILSIIGVAIGRHFSMIRLSVFVITWPQYLCLASVDMKLHMSFNTHLVPDENAAARPVFFISFCVVSAHVILFNIVQVSI